MDYFAADLHFNHKRILSFERYQFATILKHDEFIMSVLENTLTLTDKLYLLGDVGWPSDEIKERFKSLKCKKYLIKGNHDKNTVSYYKEDMGFDEVYDHPIWYSNRIVLSHYPVPVEDEVVNVHGHLHGSTLDFRNYINVNIHMLGYKLCKLSRINSIVSSLPKPNTKFLQEWFAGHQLFTEEEVKRRTDILFDEKGIAIRLK